MRHERLTAVLLLAFVVSPALVLVLPRTPAFGAAVTAAAQDASAVEAALGLDRPTRRLIQQRLRNEGFDPGAPDGLFGPRTRNAIRRWQEARGVLATGYLDSEQAELLRGGGAPPAGSNEPPPRAGVELPAVPAEAVTEMPRHAGTEPGPAQAVAQGSTRASPPVTEASNAPAPERCETWNEREFFETATVEEVTACLAAGADVAARDDNGRTPLFAAAASGTPPIVAALLAAGADLKVRADNGDMPLHSAARFNEDPAVIEALVAAGVDVEARGGVLGKYTPLHYAAGSNENPAVIDALVAVGADVAARDHRGQTPLHLAAQSNENAPVVDALLAAGADVAERDDGGRTPLHYAANPAIIEALLAAGADVAARAEDGRTPQHSAARRRNENAAATIEVLLTAGTPLHYAVNSPPAGIEVLLAAGADVAARDIDGNTPLHGRNWASDSVGLETLLAAGASLEARNRLGRTPLHAVVEDDPRYGGYLESRAAAISTLAAAGSNLDARDRAGTTPLHLASAWIADSYDPDREWRVDSDPHAGAAIEALLEAGADPGLRNAEGRTPWDLADQNEALKASDVYWRLNDAQFNAPREESRRPTAPDLADQQPAASERPPHQGPACEIPGYPAPDDVQSMGVSWCESNVDFQRRVFALQAAGAWCAIAEGTSSSPEQVSARHQEINAAGHTLDALDALAPPRGTSCQCPAGYRP